MIQLSKETRIISNLLGIGFWLLGTLNVLLNPIGSKPIITKIILGVLFKFPT